MDKNIIELKWNDKVIPHKLSIQKNKSGTIIQLIIVKDVEPQCLSLELDIDLDIINKSWTGEAGSVSSIYNDDILFNDTRVLFNTTNGCVLWGVNHIRMSNGKKMSVDTLSFIPSINSRSNKLVYCK